ncbi:MAG: dockerin type I repeat-containing protein [Oscillospiraceae bacterium]|nr:dockerin type I repeat-containing protein [Oscillospiraceae bacterium]
MKIQSDNGCINNAKLRCGLDISGDLKITGMTFNLNGNIVNIDGNLYQYDGIVILNTGALNVSGNYLIVRDEDSAVYSVSNGILNMTNDGDKVSVGGNFITMTDQNHSDHLTAGTLEIKGDFYQYDDGTAYAFPASGTHKVILSGTDKQMVTFESYDSSHFNLLSMTQDASQYVFSDDPCWTELTDIDQPPVGDKVSGDVNGDESIDLKDVIILRRYLAGWEVTINDTNADVNGDSSVDLKDVTILRRYLAGWEVTLV